MVTINLTLLIELGLFLLFLWGTQRYILTPVLKSIDEREESIEADHSAAEENAARADELEGEYRHEIAVIRRKSDEKVRAAQQQSQQEHQAFLQSERERAEEAVGGVRAEAMAMVEEQRAALIEGVPALTERIKTKLTGRNGS